MEDRQTLVDQLHAVKGQIARNDLDQALDQLMDLLQARDDEAYDECVTIYRRYHSADKEHRLQLISYENYQIAINNVSYGLLRLCTQQIRQLESTPSHRSAGIAVGDVETPSAGAPGVSLLTLSGIEKYQAKDYAGAVADLESALEKDKGEAHAAFFLGVIREQIGDSDGARQFYDRAISANPNHAEAINNRGVLSLLEDDYQGALQDINRALELNPKLYLAYLNRASVFVHLEEYELALDDLNQCARSGTSLPEVLRLRSLTKLNLGDNQGAIEDAERGIKLDPGDFYNYFSKGTALVNLDRYREAITLFDEALDRNPGHYESLRLRASARCMIEDWAAARRDLEALLAALPDDDQGHFWLGFLFQQTGDPASAIRKYSEAIQANPHNKTAYFNRGLIALQHGRNEEALRDFRMARDLAPDWELVKPYLEQAEQKVQGGGFWKKLFG